MPAVDFLVCISPNPALDRVALATGATSGGTVRATAFLETPGGKGAHVAMVAAALGVPARVVLPLGGVNGARFAALAAAAGLALDVVPIASGSRGTYTIVDSDAGALIEAIEPAPMLDEGEAEAFLARAAAAAGAGRVVVTSGSLPGGVSETFHAAIVAAASPSAFVVVDTGGEALGLALEARPGLVKPNLSEAAALVGIAVPSVEPASALVPLVIELRERGARNAWVSLGARGSLLATEDGAVWHLPAPLAGRPVNATGCGDALAGGFAAAYVAGCGVLDAALNGVAAAACKLLQLHPGRVVADDVARLRPTIEPQRLA
jgi:1-phosphofructokinase family hexose kinase